VKDQVAALRAIDEAWQSACRGGAEAVLLEGDAGLGKSHVLEQFVSRVRADQPQAVCLVARGLESERRHQGGLVRQLLGTVPADAGLRAADLTVAPERLREAAAKVAGVVPLLVVVDDATLADDASQDALGALVEAPPAGALVLLASRPFMLSEVRFRAALQRNAALRRLALAPLQPAAAGELVRSLLTLEEPLAATLADRLCDERRGNPGLIAATLSVMMDEGYLVPGGTGWRAARELPAALPIATDPRERTRRLLPRLSAPARSALEAAAVPGDAVDLAVLAPVAALDAATLEVALQELVVRRLLRSSVRGEGWLEFTSGAVRLAVLDQLGLPRRRTLQRAHERAVRHRYGSRSREPIAYERPVRQQPGPLGLLRSTLAAAVGLLG
jgi:hypothetical protein